MKYGVLVFLGVLLILGGSFTFKTYDSKGGEPAEGKETYVTHCSTCHGEKGLGDGMLANTLPQKPPDLNAALSAFFNYDSVLIDRVVMNGKADAGMPAYKGVLSKQEVKDIFAYIRSINKG